MRYFTVLFFLIHSLLSFSQEKNIRGILLNESDFTTVGNADIVNLSNFKFTTSKADGSFTILANINDTLYISAEGFHNFKIKVNQQWLNEGQQRVYIKDTSIVLDEVVINSLQLTGILSVDTKLIALADYPYYRDLNATGFTMAYNTGINPLHGIYNAIKRRDNKKIAAIKQEVDLIERMKTRYDRTLASALLNISKNDIITILQRCDHSERFIYTANDYQIFNAVNECYSTHQISN